MDIQYFENIDQKYHYIFDQYQLYLQLLEKNYCKNVPKCTTGGSEYNYSYDKGKKTPEDNGSRDKETNPVDNDPDGNGGDHSGTMNDVGAPPAATIPVKDRSGHPIKVSTVNAAFVKWVRRAQKEKDVKLTLETEMPLIGDFLLGVANEIINTMNKKPMPITPIAEIGLQGSLRDYDSGRMFGAFAAWPVSVITFSVSGNPTTSYVSSMTVSQVIDKIYDDYLSPKTEEDFYND